MKKKIDDVDEKVIKVNKSCKEWVDEHEMLRVDDIATIKNLEERIRENAKFGEQWREKAPQLQGHLELLHDVCLEYASN